MIGFSGAISGLSAHFTAGSSQLMHWRSVRPEKVTTGTIRFPHFGQRVRSIDILPIFSPLTRAIIFRSSGVLRFRWGSLANPRAWPRPIGDFPAWEWAVTVQASNRRKTLPSRIYRPRFQPHFHGLIFDRAAGGPGSLIVSSILGDSGSLGRWPASVQQSTWLRHAR
jgi:hypothetical protein